MSVASIGAPGSFTVSGVPDVLLEDHLQVAIASKDVIGAIIQFEGTNEFEGSDEWCLSQERTACFHFTMTSR